MKNKFVIACVFAFLVITACSKSNENVKSEAPVVKQPTVQAPESLPPTKVVTAFIDACRKKDMAALSNTLSSGSYRLAEESAKQKNKNVSEILTACNIGEQLRGTNNEKIYSDSATVEVQNTKTNQYDKIPFVKEGGVWKIAADQFYQELQKQADEDQRKEDQQHEDQLSRLDSKVKVDLARADVEPTYTLEDKLERSKVLGEIEKNGLLEKRKLIVRHFAIKEKIIKDKETVSRGVFFGCMFY